MSELWVEGELACERRTGFNMRKNQKTLKKQIGHIKNTNWAQEKCLHLQK